MLTNFETYKLIKESVKLIFDEDSMSIGTDLSKFLNDLDDNLETLVDDAILSRLEELLSIQGFNVIENSVSYGNYKIYIETAHKVYLVIVNKNKKDILTLQECYKSVILKTEFNAGILGVIGSFNNLKDLIKELKIHDQDKMTSLEFRNMNNVPVYKLVHDADLEGTLEEVKARLLSMMDKFSKVEFPYDGHIYDMQRNFDDIGLIIKITD